jgi:uncharacterized protein (TIGR02147 family)
MISSQSQQLTHDFQKFLREELIARCRRNPRFSMRAFAKILGIENSALSKIIHGKRAMSSKMIVRLGTRLGLGPDELSRFSALPQLRQYSDDQCFYELSLDEFSVISDWYHYAIHELTKVRGFKSDTSWIARQLGISIAEASAAIDRLLRLKFLKRDSFDSLVNCSGALTTTRNEFTAAAFRNMQRQLLEKSQASLEEISLERRDHSAMTMAISTKKLAAAKRKIAEFRRDMSQFLENDKANLDSVYCLQVSLFPLSSLRINR